MNAPASDTLVIGGGLHGLSAALHLARRGRRVTVLERAFTGRHASGASAAGVRTLGRDPREMPLALGSMEMWHRIAELVDDDCGFHAHGQIRVAATGTQLEAETARVERLTEAGYRNERIIDQAELRALAPGVNPKFLGAAYAENDGAADPHKTLIAFRAAAERAGVSIREGSGVVAITRRGAGWRVVAGEATHDCAEVVNASGAWGARVAALIGEEIPLSAKASMMMVTERLEQAVRPVLSIVGRPLSFKQTSQGTLVLGGGIQGRYDLDSGETFIDFRALAAGAAAARELMPAAAGARVVRCWSGIEGKTADLLPVIGPSARAEGFYHVFGFSGHGFQLVPAAGAAVAEIVETGEIPDVLRDFSPTRFHEQGAAA